MLEKPKLDEHHRFVSKPWGSEYLVYRSPSVDLWYLHIKANEQTSLHCHPNKKTGLVVLSGYGQVSFLNDAVPAQKLDKFILRPGLFHSTKAVNGPVTLLEIETPPNKHDLVRLSDNYGRTDQPYEDPDQAQPANLLWLSDLNVEYNIDDCTLKVVKINAKSDMLQLPDDALIMVLSGGLVADPEQYVLSPADVVVKDTILKLSCFRAHNLVALLISPWHKPI